MSHRLLHVLTFGVPLLFAGFAAAQGSDDCATAQAISGLGAFPFNNAAATTSPQGQSNPTCSFFGSTAIQRDVWYSWTSPITDHVEIATCGSSVDTKLAVYAGGGCPVTTPLACNDDGCSLQSSVGIDVVQGNSYTIQLGVFPGAAGGSGNFTVGIVVPPPPCGTNTGPDVIVGNVTDVMNVTSAGGIDAIALGTDACNVGTAPVTWQASTPNHPVIRQNLYRYKVVNGAGRFEQLGASWLKHAFAAVNGSLCCTCQGGGGLGVGCSDPYGSGLNGNQSSAGPNWQVNAFTGVFTYPPANPAWSGAIARRCQVPVAELEATVLNGTTHFYGECHYVTADDAQAGNGNNNASWREMSCTQAVGGEFSLALQGGTNRGDPAIRAWPLVEPGVVLTNVQVPSDGLVIVGSHSTPIGVGAWHYEFAVYNMNSDRNVGSFSIPVQPGVTVSNIGFHDISYHDGDGQGSVTTSGADWVGSVSGGFVTWACETQAVNANANAIRWGSLYAFRFDSDAQPTNGVATLGLWKPGVVSSVTANAEVPGITPFSKFCQGDGSVAACPCGNNGSTGHGCANSVFAAGAELVASGQAYVSNDTTFLAANNVTGPWCLFFQGDGQQAPLAIDDGLGCVTGNLLRLGTQPIGGAASQFPEVGDPSVSVRGAIPVAGGTYYYQAFYRNGTASFCPTGTSNRTNGIVVTWSP